MQPRRAMGQRGLTLTKNKYLEALEKFNIEPNFWCSDEYFEKAGWEVVAKAGLAGVLDGDGFLMLPLLDLVTGGMFGLTTGVWAGLGDETGKFLDYNFIYNPKRFQDLSGGDFQVFRKNSRKFINRNPDKKMHYIDVNQTDGNLIAALPDILCNWLEGKPEDVVIQDDEVLLSYLNEGRNRKVLLDQYGNVYGINIWDDNYRYINYRYCFCKPGQFLSEYMRLLFYTDENILGQNKLVNDGGCLDDKNLYNFKTKLNPEKINKIYSWE